MKNKKSQFVDLTAEFVSPENFSVLRTCLCKPSGEWTSLSSLSSDAPNLLRRINDLQAGLSSKMYMMWLNYPEASQEDEYCVVFFFADVLHLSNCAVVNRRYILDNE